MYNRNTLCNLYMICARRVRPKEIVVEYNAVAPCAKKSCIHVEHM